MHIQTVTQQSCICLEDSSSSSRGPPSEEDRSPAVPLAPSPCTSPEGLLVHYAVISLRRPRIVASGVARAAPSGVRPSGVLGNRVGSLRNHPCVLCRRHKLRQRATTTTTTFSPRWQVPLPRLVLLTSSYGGTRSLGRQSTRPPLFFSLHTGACPGCEEEARVAGSPVVGSTTKCLTVWACLAAATIPSGYL